MACFVVPVAEAIVANIAANVIERREEKKALLISEKVELKKNSVSKSIRQLSHFLYGGSALLAFEHVWHGEVTPWAPFLTAAQSAQETRIMLQEMATVGVTMALAVTAVWGIVTYARKRMEKTSVNKGVAK